MLPNVVVDGDLVVEASGEVFVPAGANFSDLEGQIATKQSKSELAYDVGTSNYIPNTLASGAIIERGSNANGEYVKYADGTMIATIRKFDADIILSTAVGNVFSNLVDYTITYPATFAKRFSVITQVGRLNFPVFAVNQNSIMVDSISETSTRIRLFSGQSIGTAVGMSYITTVIGTWK